MCQTVFDSMRIIIFFHCYCFIFTRVVTVFGGWFDYKIIAMTVHLIFERQNQICLKNCDVYFVLDS